MGSGKEFREELKKHGKYSFTREIISEHESRQELINAEREYVNKDFIGENSYNLRVGGRGAHQEIGLTRNYIHRFRKYGN